ncbi:MAG TPA: alpha/beta fold hydrolase [Gemmatimonadaceae bacterium]
MPEVAEEITSSNALDRCLLTGRPGAPVVVVLGGISANRDVRGWWPAVVGEGRPLDTREFRVLGVDFLDGGERADGRPERAITTHDQADLIASALDELHVERAHAFIGASYGGMVALAFAERYASRVQQLLVISAPASAHPMSTAVRSVQRRIVELGLDTGRAREAMAIARGLAMTTYRSAEEFEGRFGLSALGSRQGVESYLRHHGEKFAATMSAARFLALSLSTETHRVDPTNCRTPALFVAARGDTIVPLEQMQHLSARWGGAHRLVETQTHTGHDAFLAEPKAVGALIHDTLTSRIAS